MHALKIETKICSSRVETFLDEMRDFLKIKESASFLILFCRGSGTVLAFIGFGMALAGDGFGGVPACARESVVPRAHV